jgi:hypothetical protein
LTRREFRPYFSVNRSRSASVTPEYRLLALPASMSPPGPGFRLVTIGSTFASKNIGRSRARVASTDSPGAPGTVAPFFVAVFTASANAWGEMFSTNLRDVRLLYGPLFSQNSLV